MARASLFLTDADNTLWDTDAVYRSAQLTLLEDTENAISTWADVRNRLAYLREVDQALARAHHGGLRYPPGLLVDALCRRLTGAPVAAAVRTALSGVHDAGLIAPIVETYTTALRRLAPLRPGVFEGLERLATLGHQVVVASEGAKDKIESLLESHGLSRFVRTVVSAPKSIELYDRLGRLTDGHRLMVGDQLDRDIAPAKHAGYFTVWFPGGFAPAWAEGSDIRPDLEIEDYCAAVAAFENLVGLAPTRSDRRAVS